MKKLILCSLLLLTACASPEQIAEQKRLQEEADFQTCLSYGLKPGREAFANCRLQLDLERQRAYNAAYYNNYWDRHPGFGFGYHHYR